MYQLKKFSYLEREMEYIIDFPENYEEGKRYPVMFYIHGYGFVGKGIENLAARCPLQRERMPEKYDFIMVAPFCANKVWLSHFETLTAFIENIVGQAYCDKSRVYLSGSSMGGYTAWDLLLIKKELFAAAVICCGGGQYWAAGLGAYNGIPLKIIHGAQDRTILSRESEIMYEVIKANGGNVELVIYEDLAHDVWTRTFSDAVIYEWLADQQRSIEGANQ